MRHPTYPKKPFSTGKRPNGPLMPRCATSRSNPLQLAPQPDLFGGKDFGQGGVDWRLGTPEDLRRSAELSLLTNEELEEMEELVQAVDEQGSLEPMLAEGISRSLANALVHGLWEDLQVLDQQGFERRSEAFLRYWRDRVKWDEEYNTEGDGREHIEDSFFADIEDKVDEYAAAFMEYLEDDPLIEQINEDLLKEVLVDPDMYEFKVTQEAGSYRGSGLWYYDLEEMHEQSDGVKRNEELAVALAPMIDADIEKAVQILEDEEPYYIGFRTRRDEVVDRETFDQSVDYHFSSSARIVADFNHEKVIKALKEKIAEEGLPESVPDEIVYRYAGTNATVGGASARGMYVIALRPDQLRMEGAALGICVGRSDQGYRESLKKGQIKLYSIRTEAGKPKFTIEVDSRTQSIDQVKGKANRLPGYEPNKSILSKPDEVRLVVEFLLSLGYTPDDIRAANDIRGGVRALEATGVDPFSPPPVRRRELQAPRPNRAKQDAARRMVAEDYAHPWGGQWGV